MQNTIDKTEIEQSIIEIQEAIKELNACVEANKHVLGAILSDDNVNTINSILDALKLIKIDNENSK